MSLSDCVRFRKACGERGLTRKGPREYSLRVMSAPPGVKGSESDLSGEPRGKQLAADSVGR